MSNKKTFVMKPEVRILLTVIFFIIVGVALTVSYAFFSYSKTGNNNIMGVGYINFNFNEGSNLEKGDIIPIDAADVDNTITKTFDITSHTTYSKGIKYDVYLLYGDAVSGKTRLRDDVISVMFIPPTNANGFTNSVNNCSTATSLTFTNGKALVASGLIKNTSNLISKTYTLKLWIDSSKISISSTTKRTNNTEGNPSLAVSTSGTTTATRYMRNNSNESSTITLYPAKASQVGKIIYTTNEFSNSYYSFKIIIEANEGV